MANELNKVFQGLFQGAGAVADGLMEKSRKNKLNELYTSSLDKLNQFLNPQATYQQDGQNIPRSQVSKNMLNGTPTEQVQTPDIKGAMNYLFEQTPKFMQQGDEGKQYSNLLSQYFEANQPPQTNYDIREVGGQLVRYDKNNPSSFEVVYGEPKKEKKKNTVGDYEKMSAEDVKKLDDNEFWDAFKFVSEDVRNELLKNPFVQQEYDRTFKENDFAPKLKTGGKITGGKINIKDSQSDDLGMFDGLKNVNNIIRAGQELTPEMKRSYETYRATLGKKYNLNDTELAQVIDQLNNSSTDKERKQIIQSLDNGKYYNDVGTNQEQMDYDRNRILEWQQALNDVYSSDPNSYDGYKQNFLKELQDFYQRGSITKKEYDDLRKSYF